MNEAPNIQPMPSATIVEIQRRGLGLKGKFVCVLTAAAVVLVAAAAAYNAVDDRFNLPRFPDLGELFQGEAEPGQVETEQVTRESFSTVAEYNAECNATISSAAGIKGKQDYVIDFRIFSKTAGTAKVDKRIYGDADLCAETGSVITKAVVEGEKVTRNGITTTEFKQVTATTDGLSPHRARINHQMWQNCVPERFGDSPQLVQDKQQKWRDDPNRKCDDKDFEISGAAGPAVAALKNMANTAAQTGLAMSEIPSEILEMHNGRLKADLEARLSQFYPGAKVTVNVVPKPAEDLQARIDAEVENLRRNFYQVTVKKQTNPATKKVETILNIVSPGGTEMDVKAGTSTAGDFAIRDLQLKSEQTLSLIPPPTITSTTIQARKAA